LQRLRLFSPVVWRLETGMPASAWSFHFAEVVSSICNHGRGHTFGLAKPVLCRNALGMPVSSRHTTGEKSRSRCKLAKRRLANCINLPPLFTRKQLCAHVKKATRRTVRKT